MSGRLSKRCTKCHRQCSGHDGKTGKDCSLVPLTEEQWQQAVADEQSKVDKPALAEPDQASEDEDTDTDTELDEQLKLAEQAARDEIKLLQKARDKAVRNKRR